MRDVEIELWFLGYELECKERVLFLKVYILIVNLMFKIEIWGCKIKFDFGGNLR